MVDEILYQPEEETQRRALDLYVSSATFENNFKPLSCVKISELLYNEGFENCSKSQVDRWKKLFNFDKHLEKKIELAYINKDSSMIKKNAVSKSTQETIDRFKINGEITDDLYMVVRLFIDDIKSDLAAGKRIDKDRMKLVRDLLALTTTREDKMLDRLAGAGGDKLTSEQLKKEFDEIEVEIEEDE